MATLPAVFFKCFASYDRRMRRWLPLGLAAVSVIGLVVGAYLLRERSGLEISGDTLKQLQAFVVSLGPWAPALFLGVATFRVFFAVPSWILLTVGGMAFGSTLGAVLGTVGITLSAILGFGISRFGGRGWLREWIEARYGALQQRLEKAGFAVLAATTAHPAIPMSGFHWAAGLTTLPVLGFVLAVALGASVRASVLSFLGASFREHGLGPSVLIALVVCAIGVLPLLHEPTRRRLLGRPDPDPSP